MTIAAANVTTAAPPGGLMLAIEKTGAGRPAAVSAAVSAAVAAVVDNAVIVVHDEAPRAGSEIQGR